VCEVCVRCVWGVCEVCVRCVCGVCVCGVCVCVWVYMCVVCVVCVLCVVCGVPLDLAAFSEYNEHNSIRGFRCITGDKQMPDKNVRNKHRVSGFLWRYWFWITKCAGSWFRWLGAWSIFLRLLCSDGESGPLHPNAEAARLLSSPSGIWISLYKTPNAFDVEC